MLTLPFVNTFNRGCGPISETEHKAFLLFWICRFFVCTNSAAMVAEFTVYLLAILSRNYLNIDTLFLSLLYKDMFTILHQMKKRELMKTILPFSGSCNSGSNNISRVVC